MTITIVIASAICEAMCVRSKHGNLVFIFEPPFSSSILVRPFWSRHFGAVILVLSFWSLWCLYFGTGYCSATEQFNRILMDENRDWINENVFIVTIAWIDGLLVLWLQQMQWYFLNWTRSCFHVESEFLLSISEIDENNSAWLGCGINVNNSY